MSAATESQESIAKQEQTNGACKRFVAGELFQQLLLLSSESNTQRNHAVCHALSGLQPYPTSYRADCLRCFVQASMRHARIWNKPLAIRVGRTAATKAVKPCWMVQQNDPCILKIPARTLMHPLGSKMRVQILDRRKDNVGNVKS